jgi:hypothetical protein
MLSKNGDDVPTVLGQHLAEMGMLGLRVMVCDYFRIWGVACAGVTNLG